MDSPYAPLSESCAKLLSDKTYEKRKAAALEIEKYVRYIIYSSWFVFCIIGRLSIPSASLQNRL